MSIYRKFLIVIYDVLQKWTLQDGDGEQPWDPTLVTKLSGNVDEMKHRCLLRLKPILLVVWEVNILHLDDIRLTKEIQNFRFIPKLYYIEIAHKFYFEKSHYDDIIRIEDSNSVILTMSGVMMAIKWICSEFWIS